MFLTWEMTNIMSVLELILFNHVQVSLTIMGDEPSLPWRLLSIDILVQDIETGGNAVNLGHN